MFQQSSFTKNFTLIILAITFISSCTTSGPSGLFGKKSPHEAYADKIKNAGLNETSMGQQWFAAANKSLASPLTVSLPYSETGYFAANEARAVGLIFKAKRGEKLSINVSKKPATGFALYLDLWEPATPTHPEANF
ncbi:MAG TPA: hypothetical protein VF623_10045, partial [Segetibacter sp.]